MLTTNNPIVIGGASGTNLVFARVDVATLSGGDGIAVSSNVVSVDHDGEGLIFVTNQLALELDSSTLSKSASGIKVASGGITNTEVNASAAIAYSKLAALTDGNILVGNGSNVATSVNPSGDIDIANDGTFSISSGVIVDGDINASAAIDATKIADGSISNAEFQRLDGLSEDIQTSLDAKMEDVVDDITPTLGGHLALNGQSFAA